MFKTIKRLLCNHKYIIHARLKPCYISCGDEHQERKSREYYLICSKCNNTITVIKDWQAIEIDRDNYFE